MLRLNDIVRAVERYHPAADTDLIRRAYVFSASAHRGQVRKSGEPYLVHPLAVSALLADMKLDEFAICAGILHDTIEDTEVTGEQIRAEFGDDVADIVEGVTKLSSIPYNTSYEKSAENFRRMLVAMTRDIRVILVKLADRLHNMRTLDHMRPDKQDRIAQETLDIYAPLANRLGIFWLKAELEDLCLRYLHPDEWRALNKAIRASSKAHNEYIERVKAELQTELNTHNVECEVKGRVKHLYSIWRKMKGRGLRFDEVQDVIAFRAIAGSVPACYQALGYCHAMWRPVPGRFKDFIAMPKPNGYRSLHTTVIGPEMQRIEIQIRTREMDEVAELGVAAHWRYKEGRPSDKDDVQFAWLRRLMEWQKELDDPSEFIATVKVDLFSDEVYVFTPKGEVKELRFGSTPVDFAYTVHSEVGDHCVGAKVNGRMVPLHYRLKNGDTVEVMTASSQKPRKDWLGFVKTARARARINAFLRREQRERAVGVGKELVDRELKKYGKALPRDLRNRDYRQIVDASKFQNDEEMLAAVGYGKTKAADLLRRALPESLQPPAEASEESTKPRSRLGEIFSSVARKSKSGVRVQGIDEVLVRFAKCCAPVPGDPIVGFVTRGRGITVHAVECAKTLHLDPERKLPVEWDERLPVQRSVQVRVITDDKPGILATMSQEFSGAGVNILSANCRTRKDLRAENIFWVTVQNAQQLKGVLRKIEGLSGVHSVDRMSG